MNLGAYAPLPPAEAVLGPVQASWEEIDPGVALVRVHGGTTDDRELARYLLRVQLAHHGIEHAQFNVGDDDEFRKTAHWRDLMAKAKRLIDAGNVTLLRNSRNVVAAHVVGDHGDYNCEFSRDDPDSWAITGWDCECPWSQYAWQRTRQWKKYEGRVCSHVLAAFWYARRHPMDEDYQGDLQRGMKGPGAPAPTSPVEAPGAQQQLFTPEGLGDDQQSLFGAPPEGQFTQPFQQDPQALPGTMPGGATMPGPAGAMGPPGQDIIPPQPAIPGMMEPAPPPVPGTTPGGMASPPGAVSVPGAKQPSPFNPVQYPGGTYSKVAAQADFENGMKVRLLEAEMGVAEGKSEEHGAGQYREVPTGTLGEVMGQDRLTGWVEVIFPLGSSGPMEPYHVRCFLEPRNLKIVAYPPGSPFVKRVGPHS